jgi:hypothetical protein
MVKISSGVFPIHPVRFFAIFAMMTEVFLPATKIRLNTIQKTTMNKVFLSELILMVIFFTVILSQ